MAVNPDFYMVEDREPENIENGLTALEANKVSREYPPKMLEESNTNSLQIPGGDDGRSELRYAG